MDDEDKLDLARKNIKILREKYNINMFLGNTNNPYAVQMLPLIQQEKVALFFPWVEDQSLRAPNLKYILNELGRTTIQIDKIINYVVNSLGFKKNG